MKFRSLFLFFLAFIFPLSSHSQYFDTGTDPASAKWMQIKTDRFTLIYPKSYGPEGVSYAKSLDNSLDKLTSLYPALKVKIPVVIHNYTTFSNGYVAWAPRRIEMFPTPEQNTIPLDPVVQLTSHELTHVMQMYSLRQGFMKVLSFIGGEQVTGSEAIFLPMWFMEGDAVMAESVLTGSGRGRVPSFQKQMKAIVTSGKKLYSYDKMMFGSFRDYTPDHYEFGYQVTSWSSIKYGHDIWNKALGYISKFPFTIDPLRISLVKSTGLSQEGLFHQAFDTLRAIWKNDVEKSVPEDYQSVIRTKESQYKNYYSPVTIGKDSIVVIKTSLSAPPFLVLLDASRNMEKRIFIPGPIWPWFISGAKGKVVWVEERPDIRWENRTFSDILIFDLQTRRYARLSHRTRYLAVSISPDGRFIAAAENSISNVNRILIIDSSGGEVLSSFDIPGNAFPERPIWSDSGEKITIISLTGEGEGIMSLSVKTGKWQTIIEPSRDDLQSSLYKGDTLFFVSSVSGTDNIYAIGPDGKKTRITNSRFGAYDPMVKNGKIYFSEYTPMGYRVRVTDQSHHSTGNDYKMKESFLINRLDSLKPDKNSSRQHLYNPEPYRKWQHPFRFHSWMPFYTDLDQLKTASVNVMPGVMFLSQNTLSTVVSSIGYEYSRGRNNLHYTFTWKGWIPVFESRIDYGASPVVYKFNNMVGNPSQLNPALNFSNSLSLPLTFSTGRFSQFLWSSIAAEYQNNYIYMKETGTYDFGQTQLKARLFFSNYDMQAKKDIYPRWAQIFDFSYITYPVDRNIYGPMTSFRAELYFPGVTRNHSLRLRFESDYQTARKLVLENIADLPRGYSNIVSIDYKLYSADYTLPLFYPELSVPMLIYLKRIRGGLFYDYATGNGNIYLNATGNDTHNQPEIFSSFGCLLLGDFYLFRLPVMMTGGLQAAWKSLNERPVLQLIFTIEIFGLKIGRERI